MITQETLKEVLHYEPNTGVFSWRAARIGVRVGSKAGWISDQGYVLIGLGGRKGRSYRAHRLAWLWMTGNWPKEQIDHINGIRSDNRWCNLRDVGREINGQNLRAAKSHNKLSGLLGVQKNGKRFSSTIGVDGESHYLGTYDTAEEAHKVYVSAKRLLHQGCTI